jgi:hypothetical protein
MQELPRHANKEVVYLDNQLSRFCPVAILVKKWDYSVSCNPLISLLAGREFEPLVFGQCTRRSLENCV